MKHNKEEKQKRKEIQQTLLTFLSVEKRKAKWMQVKEKRQETKKTKILMKKKLAIQFFGVVPFMKEKQRRKKKKETKKRNQKKTKTKTRRKKERKEEKKR